MYLGDIMKNINNEDLKKLINHFITQLEVSHIKYKNWLSYYEFLKKTIYIEDANPKILHKLTESLLSACVITTNRTDNLKYVKDKLDLLRVLKLLESSIKGNQPITSEKLKEIYEEPPVNSSKHSKK